MTREELRQWFAEWLEDYYDELHTEDDLTPEVAESVLVALRTPTREQVEKVWRGEWMGSGDGYADGELVYDTWTCSECGHVIDEEDDPDMLPQFCPKCYAAMTDEAVDMMLERWKEVLEDG